MKVVKGEIGFVCVVVCGVWENWFLVCCVLVWVLVVGVWGKVCVCRIVVVVWKKVFVWFVLLCVVVVVGYDCFCVSVVVILVGFGSYWFVRFVW